jgi:hypothetical protein
VRRMLGGCALQYTLAKQWLCKRRVSFLPVHYRPIINLHKTHPSLEMLIRMLANKAKHRHLQGNKHREHIIKEHKFKESSL